MWEDINQEGSSLENVISFNVTEKKMMIIDSGKLHSLIRTITCEYLTFYAKGERSSSFIQELFSTYNIAGTVPVSGNI